MANAETLTAPSKKERAAQLTKEDIALSQVFDTEKKYMFELAVKNPERELPVINMVTKRPIQHVEFPPYRNIVLTSQIVWNGKGILTSNVWTGRRMIRYYDGCESIFVDEQPKDKDTIEQLIKQTNRDKYNFIQGKFGCYGDERMLLLYMFICSWNGESEFRTRTADGIFIPSNKDKAASLEAERLDNQETALQYAKEATKNKMLMHAHFLGIPLTDWDSGNDLSEKEIRTVYRRKALTDSKTFIDSYGNKAIETKYYIDKALLEGLINNKFNPNKATWKTSNTEICDISGLKSNEAIADKLFEFSQMDEGSEFEIQLKSIYN